MMNPNNRREAFLAKMAGMDVACPEPATREEMYLAACAENAGGGGGGVTKYVIYGTEFFPAGLMPEDPAFVPVPAEEVAVAFSKGEVLVVSGVGELNALDTLGGRKLISFYPYGSNWYATMAKYGGESGIVTNTMYQA